MIEPLKNRTPHCDTNFDIVYKKLDELITAVNSLIPEEPKKVEIPIHAHWCECLNGYETCNCKNEPKQEPNETPLKEITFGNYCVQCVYREPLPHQSKYCVSNKPKQEPKELEKEGCIVGENGFRYHSYPTAITVNRNKCSRCGYEPHPEPKQERLADVMKEWNKKIQLEKYAIDHTENLINWDNVSTAAINHILERLPKEDRPEGAYALATRGYNYCLTEVKRLLEGMR